MELLKLSSFPFLKPTALPKPSLPAPPSFKPRRPPAARATLTMSGPPQTAEGGGAVGMEDAMDGLMRERIIFVGNYIDDFIADVVATQLLLLDFQDPAADIRLFLNTRGGSFSASMAIYDVMQLVRADVSTIALGTTEETASVILGGGTKGKRFSMPNSRIMITQPMGSVAGIARNAGNQTQELMSQKKIIIGLISGFTGRAEEQVGKDIDRDRFMSPIEAVEYGIIDGVIDRERIIPVGPLPRKIRATRVQEFSNDPIQFLKPDVPTDEIL